MINGTGSGQPSGLIAGAQDTGLHNTPSANGRIDFEFLQALYFSLNRHYRNSPKCAWVMNDAQYENIRNLKDNNGRPLLNIEDDKEVLFGKRVVVSPDMPGASSPSVAAKIILGDLSHFVVRVSAMTVVRSLESGLPNGIGDVTRGECLLNGRMRADSIVHDASNGSVPPVIFGSVYNN